MEKNLTIIDNFSSLFTPQLGERMSSTEITPQLVEQLLEKSRTLCLIYSISATLLRKSSEPFSVCKNSYPLCTKSGEILTDGQRIQNAIQWSANSNFCLSYIALLQQKLCEWYEKFKDLNEEEK